MLQHIAHYNDFTPEFIDELEKKIDSFGKVVRYRFDIEKPNPDKEHYNGKTVFPQMYTLDPAVFNITDKHEKRTGKQKVKTVANIKTAEMNEHGVLIPTFNKIRIKAGARGVLRLDLTVEEDRDICRQLELHPKLKNGEFADSQRVPVVTRVDEVADATTARVERGARLTALNAVNEMSDEKIREFAAGMQWDDTQEIEVLRNQAETLADSEPIFFNDVIKSGNIEYQALVQQALNKGVIVFDQAEYKYSWGGNKQPITVLSPTGEKSHIEKMGEFLKISANGKELAKKIKSLTSGKAEVAV
ncbi:MAG: hypothetical protein V4547_16880 [Bacteroidota bacterium]